MVFAKPYPENCPRVSSYGIVRLDTPEGNGMTHAVPAKDTIGAAACVYWPVGAGGGFCHKKMPWIFKPAAEETKATQPSLVEARLAQSGSTTCCPFAGMVSAVYVEDTPLIATFSGAPLSPK